MAGRDSSGTVGVDSWSPAVGTASSAAGRPNWMCHLRELVQPLVRRRFFDDESREEEPGIGVGLPLAPAVLREAVDKSHAMAERLHTPWTHKLIISPFGRLLNTCLFEWLKSRSLPREFRLARAGAAAAETVGEDVDAFLDALGVAPDELSDDVRDRLPGALASFAEDWRARIEAIDAWRKAFWGDEDVGPDERVAREETRREASERCVTPSGALGVLAREKALPPVQCDVPPPATTFDTWADALNDPAGLYAVPEENILTWDAGHFGVLVRLYREADAQDQIKDALDHASPSNAA